MCHSSRVWINAAPEMSVQRRVKNSHPYILHPEDSMHLKLSPFWTAIKMIKFPKIKEIRSRRWKDERRSRGRREGRDRRRKEKIQLAATGVRVAKESRGFPGNRGGELIRICSSQEWWAWAGRARFSAVSEEANPTCWLIGHAAGLGMSGSRAGGFCSDSLPGKIATFSTSACIWELHLDSSFPCLDFNP